MKQQDDVFQIPFYPFPFAYSRVSSTGICCNFICSQPDEHCTEGSPCEGLGTGCDSSAETGGGGTTTTTTTTTTTIPTTSCTGRGIDSCQSKSCCYWDYASTPPRCKFSSPTTQCWIGGVSTANNGDCAFYFDSKYCDGDSAECVGASGKVLDTTKNPSNNEVAWAGHFVPASPSQYCDIADTATHCSGNQPTRKYYGCIFYMGQTRLCNSDLYGAVAGYAPFGDACGVGENTGKPYCLNGVCYQCTQDSHCNTGYECQGNVCAQLVHHLIAQSVQQNQTVQIML
ncbi:hypothetical protein ACFLS9_05080 [Bacteroidota bacterium]